MQRSAIKFPLATQTRSIPSKVTERDIHTQRLRSHCMFFERMQSCFEGFVGADHEHHADGLDAETSRKKVEGMNRPTATEPTLEGNQQKESKMVVKKTVCISRFEIGGSQAEANRHSSVTIDSRKTIDKAPGFGRSYCRQGVALEVVQDERSLSATSIFAPKDSTTSGVASEECHIGRRTS
ncbi:hypothetical protein M407DRAFT_34000 [Tulasnella calospora MUT 4182]|uniref:Uncharacterized protein n=1 Tax=Tulasnella calospora MUT 4182 TaxID=1051891 RepID=A0A0C3L417_9AGAM|nr:hypothetical protein M407DRAFT_34000 [Tulasnella calospora MUT 4182]